MIKQGDIITCSWLNGPHVLGEPIPPIFTPEDVTEWKMQSFQQSINKDVLDMVLGKTD